MWNVTKEELAKQLHGADMLNIVPEELVKVAKENNLVILYGYSDDLLELEGAIHDEVDAWNGVTIHLSKKGLSFPSCDDEDCCCNLQSDPEGKPVSAYTQKVGEEYYWMIDTKIPHASFDILDKRETDMVPIIQKFCKGIVIDLKEI